jgi:PhnB protein
MAVQPIPEGYHSLSPYLAVDDAEKAIDFYKRAFGATERYRFSMPDGRVGHAELQIGDSFLMLSDPFEEATSKPPKELGGTSFGIFLYVEDVDETVQRAVDSGATLDQPVEDMFWGDRYGKVTDPFGHQWLMATHVEVVSMEEIAKRGQEAMASQEAG